MPGLRRGPQSDQRSLPRQSGNEADPIASAEQRKAENAERWPEEQHGQAAPIEQSAPR